MGSVRRSGRRSATRCAFCSVVGVSEAYSAGGAAAGGAAHRGGKTTCFGLKMEGIVGLGSFWCCWVFSTVELDCDLLPTGKSQSARCQGKHLNF